MEKHIKNILDLLKSEKSIKLANLKSNGFTLRTLLLMLLH